MEALSLEALSLEALLSVSSSYEFFGCGEGGPKKESNPENISDLPLFSISEIRGGEFDFDDDGLLFSLESILLFVKISNT